MSSKRQKHNRSRNKWMTTARLFCVVGPSMVFGIPAALADGTEILEPTSAILADGSRIVGAGVGLSMAQPGDISIDIPAGASVEQVLLYWDGADRDYSDDAPIIGTTEDTIQVSGNDVTGKFIGGRTFSPATQLFTFRADITALQLLAPGPNTLSVGGLDFGNESVATGAGVLAILDDGSAATLNIFDGNDYAYHRCSEDFNCTVTAVRTFVFPASR